LIGRFLKQRRDKDIFVSTKVGRFPDPGWPKNFSLNTFQQHTEASLQRLGVEALDLTQLHSIPTEYYRQGDVFEWLRRFQQQGKIKRFGVSVESMEEVLLCLEQEGLSSLQIIFNIFRRKPIEALFDQAKARGVALIVRLPLASGLLAGKMTCDTAFEPGDHRHFNRDGQRFNVGETFAGLPFEVGVAAADQVKPLVPSGMTMAQMALRWVLDFDAVSVVIPGARNPQQARDNAAASGLNPLSPEVHDALKRLYDEHVVSHIRGPY
jgi:aryl-alcohol dehydrogenase-like predicted oxidoreductase